MTNQKVVLITGATGGIGSQACKLFGQKGYAVAMNDCRKEPGEQAVARLAESGVAAAFFLGDATREDEVNNLVQQTVAKFGRIDVLINNIGGLGGRCPVEEMTTEFYNKVMDLNMTSVFYATRACIPHLKTAAQASGDAAIINVTTIAAYNGGGPGASIYGVSKAGVLTFTKALAKELIPFGIRVNAVSPGTIDTPFHSATAPEIIENWKKGIPAQRLGRPEEVASVMYFLASEQASYVVGEVIQINGGQMMD
jgi:meso-butanediol dehydrogenase/(S,S)-butanediol dehydrogenase/diacetyl reductase